MIRALIALLTFLLFVAPSLAADKLDPAVAAAHAFRRAEGARILAEYADFLAIPNSAQHPEGLQRNAEHIRRELQERGFEAEIWALPGAAPAVFGWLENPGAKRTLALYAHYDGQPVDPAQWRQSPWEPTLYTAALEEGGSPRPLPQPGEAIDPEWRLYARSAGDDKVPFAALFAALDALARDQRPLTSNLIVLFEGEEESGSPHLDDYLRQHRPRLEADLWLICDGPVHQSRRPQLVFGVRGYAGLEITLYGADRYLHSGHYGNWAPNPAMELARLLATMKDAEGRVLVEGFYADTVPPGPGEQEALEALPDFDGELRHELSLAATEAGNAPLAERLLIPSLNIRGLESAAVGERARNIIPTLATASVDIRLAKGDDPERMLDRVEAHIRAQGFHIVREEPDRETRLAHPRIARVVRSTGNYPAARTAMDLPQVEELVVAARRAAGEEILLLPTMGGSLPLYLFSQILETPLVIVPMANHDNNQHAPNENLRLANLWYGVDLMAAVLTMEAGATEE